MHIMPPRRIRDEKMKQLQSGQIAYAESKEIIRLIRREINKMHLDVDCDETDAGCWFTPIGTGTKAQATG